MPLCHIQGPYTEQPQEVVWSIQHSYTNWHEPLHLMPMCRSSVQVVQPMWCFAQGELTDIQFIIAVDILSNAT